MWPSMQSSFLLSFPPSFIPSLISSFLSCATVFHSSLFVNAQYFYALPVWCCKGNYIKYFVGFVLGHGHGWILRGKTEEELRVILSHNKDHQLCFTVFMTERPASIFGCWRFFAAEAQNQNLLFPVIYFLCWNHKFCALMTSRSSTSCEEWSCWPSLPLF